MEAETKATHVVIDLVYHEDEGNEVHEGSQQECLDWVDEQCMGSAMASFTYEVKPIIRKQ